MSERVTRNIDKEGDKKPETETINIIDEYIITKEHVTSLSKDNTNLMHNNILENKDYLNY